MPETKYCQSKTMSCTSHSHNFWPPRGVSCSIPWIRPSTNQSTRSRQAIKRISITCIYYRPVLARFIPMLLKGDMLGLILGLILGLSSLSVPFILANSFSCSFLYWSMDSSCRERESEVYGKCNTPSFPNRLSIAKHHAFNRIYDLCTLFLSLTTPKYENLLTHLEARVQKKEKQNRLSEY